MNIEDKTVPLKGLSAFEASVKLKGDGYNEIPQAQRRSPVRIVFEVMREPMLALLLVGGLIYLLIGSLSEALVLMAFAVLSIAITIVQEARTEKVLEALRDLSSPSALVIRDEKRLKIAGRDVVVGDVILAVEGDRIVADAHISESHDLLVDESLITGESLAVTKDASDRILYSGTLVVRGTATATVFATGVKSKIGQIGRSLNELEVETPRLQTQIRKLVVFFAMMAFIVCLLVVLLYGLLRGGWLEALLAGIALGMSMLPEEFPVVLAVFMAMGAWRISKARVLTRKASAIETLGTATVLCTDKTGTLTENKMSLTQYRLKDDTVFTSADVLSASCVALITYGRLACTPNPFDPMEKAFFDFKSAGLSDVNERDKLIKTYGIRPDFLAMTNVWQDETGKTIVAAKGAPEAIAKLCGLETKALKGLNLSIEAMAKQGLRVIGVARASHDLAQLPDSQKDFTFEFLGLIGLSDPLRASVPNAVKECHLAGIRVVMITGDYPITAQAIARQAGIFDGAKSETVITGDALLKMSDTDLTDCLKEARVFARIQPEQKLRIVQALKASGEIVAMTGDGVNDAPSLKAANIGIAMGKRGTEVAREASSLILLDDDFGSIVTTIRLGRRIYDNIRKAIGFILAVHVPIAGLALLPLIFGMPILFGPMHIAFLEMVIDPVCSLVFEAESEEETIMQRPPRPLDEPVISKLHIVSSLFQGVLAFLVVTIVYLVTLKMGWPDDKARALTFVSLIMVIVALILVNRSLSASVVLAFKRVNRALGYVLIAVTIMLFVILYQPFVRALFHFGDLSFKDLAFGVLAGVITLLVLEGIKFIWRQKTLKHTPA